MAAGGRFESSLTWDHVGTPVLVQPNNPFDLSGAGETSVRLRAGDAITSPTVCVSELHPYMRFVARALDKASRLEISVLWTDDGVRKDKVLEELPADLYQVWGPSKLVPLGLALPTGNGEAHEVRLRFRLKDGFGDWLVDDVYVDPAGRG